MYLNEFDTRPDIAADPVIAYMTAQDLGRAIENTRNKMLKAAKDMEFIEAARLRDEMLKMQARLDKMTEA